MLSTLFARASRSPVDALPAPVPLPVSLIVHRCLYFAASKILLVQVGTTLFFSQPSFGVSVLLIYLPEGELLNSEGCLMVGTTFTCVKEIERPREPAPAEFAGSHRSV